LPSNLVELIQTNLSFEKDLEKFKRLIWTRWNSGHIKNVEKKIKIF
jgi:hypothetical protein